MPQKYIGDKGAFLIKHSIFDRKYTYSAIFLDIYGTSKTRTLIISWKSSIKKLYQNTEPGRMISRFWNVMGFFLKQQTQ